MYIKMFFRFALMAVLTVGLSLAATSCKDDDKNNGNGSENTPEAVDDQTSLEEYQLQSVIANFAGIDAADVVLTKSYEPEIGVVDDASKPNVRSIAVGTIGKADTTAVLLLSALGIDAANPAGFSYSSDMVGTASYQHGGGDANTLATINLALKQMPGLVQLRLTKTAGENANTLPRYKVGVIVKYKNHYWVCAHEAAAYKDNAYFITFDHTGDLHKKSTFNWTLSWKDTYWQHDTPMADANILSYWLANFVLNDAGWQQVKSNYRYAKNNKEEYQLRDEDLEQLIPTTAVKRNNFVNQFFKADLDSDIPFVTDMVSKSHTDLSYAESEIDIWEDYDKGKGHLKAPVELLCNNTRYSTNIRSNNQFWVPYLFLCPKTQVNTFSNHLRDLPSQNTSKFTFSVITPSVRFTSKELESQLGTNELSIMIAARYWEHEYFNDNNWLLFDFTKDWRNKPEAELTADHLWISRCITSKSIAIADNGETASGFTDLYVARDMAAANDGTTYARGFYQPGDVLKDSKGALWMCIFGAACNDTFNFTDKTAWFISFDNIEEDNIIHEDELMEFAHRFIWGVYHTKVQHGNTGYFFRGGDQRGAWQTAYEYAGIDMNKLVVNRDSTWTFTSGGKTHVSKSEANLMTNSAYIGNDNKLKLMRCIVDNSMAGAERTHAQGVSGKSYDTPIVRLYKHYETFDTLKMDPLNADEKGLSMTMWMKPWAITDDEILLADLSDQNMVTKYAAHDKWVTLPLSGSTERQEPRQSAGASGLTWEQYKYDTKTHSILTGMYNEPVLIMRMLKVTDNGTSANLTAQDGTKLTIVKRVENPYVYDSTIVPMVNFMLRNNYLKSLIFLDNKPYQSDYQF